VRFPHGNDIRGGLTDHYVYSGDLLRNRGRWVRTSAGASRFCSTALLSTALAEHRFARCGEGHGREVPPTRPGNGQSQIHLKNMGTPFGTWAASRWRTTITSCISTPSSVPVWKRGRTSSSIRAGQPVVAACYFAREKIPEFSFKISMLLSTQNAIQFRMLMNIVKAYLRDDGTTPIYEINIGQRRQPGHLHAVHGRAQARASRHTPDAHLRSTRTWHGRF